MSKDELDAANEFTDQKNEKIIKDSWSNSWSFYWQSINQLNPNEQNFQNTTDVFDLPPQLQLQLNKTVFKKIIKQPKIQPTPL